MTNELKVELGDFCECEITGFKGVAVARGIFRHTVDRFSIQPPVGIDGKIPDAYDIDVTSLRILEKRKAKSTEPNKLDFWLGDKVRHTDNGYEGIVDRVTIFINGCHRISVMSTKLDKDGNVKMREFFPSGELEKVETAVQTPKKQTGGPMEKSEKI